jgi:hypothetical protein
VKTQHQVVGAAWNNEKGGYDVNIKDLESNQVVDDDHCDISSTHPVF